MSDRRRPPNPATPRDAARMMFKERVDAVVKEFMLDNRDLDWVALMADAAGRDCLDRKFLAYLLTTMEH